MKKGLYYLIMLCVGLTFSCSDDDEAIKTPQDVPSAEPELPEEESPSDNDNTTTDVLDSPITMADLTTFDIAWESINIETYTDTTDVVPTDETDALYDDYVENSSFTSLVKVIYSAESATVEGLVDGVEATIEGAHVTINSTIGKVEYEVSGTTTDGGLKIYSEKKFKLTLAGTNITNSQGAAINIQSKKRIFVCLAEGSTNSLVDASTYNTPDTEDEKSCLFAEGQMIFSGNGTLNVTANYKHGICSDDYIMVRPGVNINVLSAVKDGIHTNGKVTFTGGKTTVMCSGDGIDCEEESIDIKGGLIKVSTDGTATKGIKAAGKIDVTGGTILVLTSGGGEYDEEDMDTKASSCMKSDSAMTIAGGNIYLKSIGTGGKGMSCDQTITISNGNVKIITTGNQYIYGRYDSSAKGIKADGDLTISGGTVMVRTTGGEGSEGIESKGSLKIEGGDIGVHTYDDAINAKVDVSISGGNIFCYATNNDGIDSNGTINISGGLIVSCGTTVPEEGFDCDNNQFKITGGTILGIAGATSKPTANVCTQNSLAWSGSASANTRVTICKSDDTFVMSYVVPRSYNQGLTLLYSSALFEKGSSYNIYTGGSVTGGTTFNGLTLNGVFTNGTLNTSFTISSALTSAGNAMPGGPGGRR